MQRGFGMSQAGHDHVTAITAAPHLLLVGHSSGQVLTYNLPDLTPAGQPQPKAACDLLDMYMLPLQLLLLCLQL